MSEYMKHLNWLRSLSPEERKEYDRMIKREYKRKHPEQDRKYRQSDKCKAYERMRNERKKIERAERRKAINAAYIRGEVVFYTGRLKWTEEKCLTTVRQFVAEGKTPQDLRHTHRRCYEVIYEKYRYILKEFPTYVPATEHKGHTNCRGKYKDVRELISNFEGTKEEFNEAHGEWLDYIMHTPSMKRVYEGHFRCRKPTLSVLQRSIPGFGIVDENGRRRAIYVYWYDGDDRVGKIAYVGLAKDLAIRDRDHNGISRINKDRVAYYKHVLGIQWNYKVLTDFLPEQEAQQAEAHWERHYRNLGYEMLNAAPCGSLGGSGFKNVPRL